MKSDRVLLLCVSFVRTYGGTLGCVNVGRVEV